MRRREEEGEGEQLQQRKLPMAGAVKVQMGTANRLLTAAILGPRKDRTRSGPSGVSWSSTPPPNLGQTNVSRCLHWPSLLDVRRRETKREPTSCAHLKVQTGRWRYMLHGVADRIQIFHLKTLLPST